MVLTFAGLADIAAAFVAAAVAVDVQRLTVLKYKNSVNHSEQTGDAAEVDDDTAALAGRFGDQTKKKRTRIAGDRRFVED